jgi:hypothetical protein
MNSSRRRRRHVQQQLWTSERSVKKSISKQRTFNHNNRSQLKVKTTRYLKNQIKEHIFYNREDEACK